MALLNLIFRNPARAQIDALVLDCSISENHELGADITNNEIEDGSNISDHVRLQPIKFTIEGMVSDSPISRAQAIAGALTATATSKIGEAIGGSLLGQLATTAAGSVVGASLQGLMNQDPRDPAKAYQVLEEIWRRRQPFVVVTALKRYDNMILTNVSAPRNASVGKSLRFTATLQQVTIVRTATVQIPQFKLKSSVAHSASSKANLGKQAAKTANTATADKGSSIALGFVKKSGFLGG